MRKILLPLAGGAMLLGGCTVVQPAPQIVSDTPTNTATGEPYCREYTATATIDGAPQDTVGMACRDASGTWHIVDAQGAEANSGTPATQPPTVVYAYPPYPYYYYPYPYPYPYYYPGFFSLGFRFGHFHHHHH